MKYTTTILYLSSSVRPLENIPFESSLVVSLNPPSATTLCSTSFDHLFICSYVIPRDDLYASLSSSTDDFGNFAASCGFPSTLHPLFSCLDASLGTFSTHDLILPAHTRDNPTRIYVDLRSPSPSHTSYSPHIPPSILYMSHSHPSHRTPSHSCHSMSPIHSHCHHCSSSSHFLSCTTIPQDLPSKIGRAHV